MSDDNGKKVSCVLLVDDEESIVKALSRLLMDEEFEVLTATSGAMGLEVLKQHDNIALIVSDQRMPGMTGAEFLEKAREIAPDTLRMILTGYADINTAMAAINQGGAFRYATKPWDDEELVQIIRDGVSRYELYAENRRLNELVKKQNAELQEWNTNLKQRVLDQTTEIRKKNEELQRLNERLKNNYRNTIVAFSGLFELLGRRLKNHAKNVANLSSNVAKALGLPPAEIELITVAALLHDIGEIGIPEAIMKKRLEDMSEAELNEYKQHSVRGQTAIDVVEDLRGAGVLIRHHHEHLDGSGFPDRLKGDAIPLGARIIGMADFVDRTMERVAGDTAQELGLKKIEAALGKTLDPALFDAFKKVIKYVYFSKPSSGEMVEVEKLPEELCEGMLLARDVYSGTGMLLLNKGVKLDESKIAAINRYYRLDPPKGGVLVLVPKN